MVRFRNTRTPAGRTMAAQILVSVRFEKTETPARFEPMPSKKHADRMLHVTFGTHKKQSFGSETTERQQESSPCQAKNTPKGQAKNTPKECLTWPLEPIKNNALVRFHNTQTPASVEPMPSKKHADRMLHATLGTYKELKNKALVRFRNTRTPGPVPKHPNASRKPRPDSNSRKPRPDSNSRKPRPDF